MSKINKFILIAVVCLASLGTGYFASTLVGKHAAVGDGLAGQSSQTQNVPETDLPAMLPSFSLLDTEGTQRSSEEWAGKILVINFWATWCEPCREEMPLLASFHEEMRNDDVEVIGIAVDDLEPVRRFGDSLGINYPSLVAGNDHGYQLLEQHNSQGVLPFSLVVDRVGNIVQRKPGVWTHAELVAAVSEAKL